MLISGLQKLTLLDFPGRVACTVFTGGCNFRCPFCHNAPLVIQERLVQDTTEENVLSFLQKRIGILDGVAVTGGEPLIHKDIDDFLKKIHDMGFAIKLDTNGYLPEHLEKIVSCGLVDKVAMDIKNAPDCYAETSGIADLDLSRIEETKNFLLSGTVDYEFRTTVVKGLHTEDSLLRAAEWIRGAKQYYLQQFKDSGDVIDIRNLGAFTEEEMRAFSHVVSSVIPNVQLRGL